MPRSRDWSRKPLRLALSLLVATSALLLHAAGVFGPLEDALTARRASLLSRDASGQMAIVEIDARSLAELRTWPWPRGYHAQVVRELGKAGASIIAFDVDFSARSAGGDEDLAAAIREADQVILPIFQQKASGEERDQRMLSSRPDRAFSSAWVGGVNIFPDADGVVREFPAATLIDGAIQPSIATLLAENNALADRSFRPDWAIDPATIPRFSFVDVMRGRVPAADLKGKRLLIGATAIELGDRYTVPRHGVMPGVVIQALAAESLLLNRAVQRTGTVVTLLGIMLIAFLLAPRPLQRPARHVALYAIVLLTVIGGPLLAQSLWPVSVDSGAWIFTVAAAAAVQAVVEARRRLRLRAETDADTGLPNRSVLEHALSKDAGASPILVAASIERFDIIREGLGLRATSDMIREAANIIRDLVQTPVYRIAPDVIALVHAEGGERSAQSALRDIEQAFRSPVATQAGPVDVSLTFGLDQDDGDAAGVLRIERALAAINSARALGTSQQWYSGSKPQLRRQLSMMSELRQAMESGHLGLAYQPKISLVPGRIGDAEALIRWSNSDVSPTEFIPLAEMTGVIREVTLFALRTALADLSLWARQGLAMRVAINISAIDLATSDFAANVEAVLRQFGVAPSQLTFEVTESALIRSPVEAIATLTRFRELGVRLSIDDYGTGQSTLSYLKQLPVHELKIDQSFVTTMLSSESDTIMVRSTINLAHELGLEVVAEGVEDGATLDALRDLGCDYAQGYFISKALTANEILQIVARSDP